MSEFTNRIFGRALKHLLSSSNKFDSQKSLALTAKVSDSVVSDLLTGRRNYGEKSHLKIAQAFELKLEDFYKLGLAIEEDLPVGDIVPPGYSELKPPQKHRPLIVDVINAIEKANLEEEIEYYRGVPLYDSGKLAANNGGYTFDDAEIAISTVVVYRPELAGRDNHELIALRVGGDSMEPIIPSGSIVIVDLDDKKFVDKKIFVVREPDSDPPIATVKRIRKADQKQFKGFALVSENRRYLPEMTDTDWPDLVVGRVIWMWRNLENA